jgi:hypothetical protein
LEGTDRISLRSRALGGEEGQVKHSATPASKCHVFLTFGCRSLEKDVGCAGANVRLEGPGGGQTTWSMHMVSASSAVLPMEGICGSVLLLCGILVISLLLMFVCVDGEPSLCCLLCLQNEKGDGEEEVGGGEKMRERERILEGGGPVS